MGMKIILQEKVVNLGNVGDIVDVKSGYSRNYLIPKGFAVRATPMNMKEFESRRAELEKKEADDAPSDKKTDAIKKDTKIKAEEKPTTPKEPSKGGS